MNEPFFKLAWGDLHLVLTPWKAVGISGAVIFASRWFVQVYYSRKAGRPVTPTAFWIMSCCGSILLLSYFFFSAKQDIVGIINNFFPCLIAIYNTYLEFKYQRKVRQEKREAEAAALAASSRPSRRMVQVEAVSETVGAAK